MNDDQRQTLTTWAMLGGVAALTFGVGLMVYVIRFLWPAQVITENSPLIIAGLFNVTYGLLALMGVMIVAQAVIAIGGRMRASFAGASIEAEGENARVSVTTPPAE